ncbi:MAG: hypothetical protein AAF830_10620 [Pseudomonadota bacterium]
MHRYTIEALDEASAGGMKSISTRDSRARFEMALSVASYGMAEFTMTSLRGMPAITGKAETAEGPVDFAATFTGRAGSTGELFTIFAAPSSTYEAMGGLDVLAANPPRAKGTKIANRAASDNPAPQPTPTTKSSSSSPRISQNAASLLAGVRGDLEKVSEENAERRRIAEAENKRQRAQKTKAERERIYKASGARRGVYPPLSGEQEYLAWPMEGPWQMQVPGDKRSPRYASLRLTSDTIDLPTALSALDKATDLKITGNRSFERLEAYTSLDGRDARILLTETKIANRQGTAFLFYGRGASSDEGMIFVLEMPDDIYKQWGGIAGMLRMRGVIESIDVFPKAERQRIANASLSQQTNFYETVLDTFYQTQTLLLMRTQAQTTAMMTELNYDLLFGDDITSPMIAD